MIQIAPFYFRKEEDIMMMSYEDFKEVVKENFREYLSKPYNGMELIITPVNKINGTLDGLNLKGDIKERNVYPTIYVQDMYEHYKKCNNLQEVLTVAASRMEQTFEQLPRMGQFDLENAEENIIFQLINTERNMEMLSDVPHREFLDLSIIYCWLVKVDEYGIVSCIVRNERARALGLSEEQLFALAKENTERLLPYSIVAGRDMALEELPDIEISPKEALYYISNCREFKGANAMLYKEIFHTLAEMLDDNLFILPSSIEQIIAVSASMYDPNFLEQTVTEVNLQIESGKVLSDKVYHYDRNTGKIGFAKTSQCIASEAVEAD